MTAANTINTNNSNLLGEFHSPSLNPPLLQSLLQRLISHPKIHNGFVDVLKLPSVRATLDKLDDDNKRAALVKTVELFAYGTVREYYALKEKGEVWTLNDVQLEKLRMLSVVSIARGQIEKFHSEEDAVGASSLSSTLAGGGDVEMADDVLAKQQQQKSKKTKKKKKSRKNKKSGTMLSIPYSRLASELRIPDDGTPYDEQKSMRQLEDLLIQCIYSNVIAAKLDQSSRSLRVEPHVALTHDPAAGGGGVGSSSKGLKKDGGCGGSVYGSVFSRDLNTLTPESTRVEASRMISSLEQFLKRSDALLTTLERSTKACHSDRKEDELRWWEVRGVVEEGPSKLRAEAVAGGGGGGIGGMQGMGMGGSMTGGGSGNNDPMEVVDMAGRRQVKRSKGGHSMIMGGGGVRFS
mmetsp:Transcript_17979/g.33502  ORF Transcript_17979/g.33502 Transcript_17979/m.33502 type:complete len:407 (-) Transcript_17979:346-1566(-)|eukprot:CAMPEP_0201678024 /NCGR_PEP_ID=MMETSP0494-20130426/45408_1 /ASSEMBLY_ACC=CAM_ASM_000839 /TAXON_ID=420259 /ORGANISM="Thalassiosira gravida, Strain GMp14c1" /LENGTH=406 /DNA_ID=CAMNT_0048161113 /DNA_START=73 /DNA_END=1293 /DNA_ORIENTATION=-